MRNFLLNRYLKKNANVQDYVGWQAVKAIVLLYDVEQNGTRPEIGQLADRLITEGKTLSILCFQEGKKPAENVPQHTFYKKDTTLFGSPKSAVRERLPQQADILIDWTKAPTSPNDFFAARIKSGLKLGVDRTLSCFDVTIQGRQSAPEMVIEEIVKYIKMINK
jgi:hypothetical protein